MEDGGRLVEALQERKLGIEEQSIQEISSIVAEFQLDINQRLSKFIEVLLTTELKTQKENGKILLGQVVIFFNNSMSNAFLKLCYGEIFSKFSSKKGQGGITEDRKKKAEKNRLFEETLEKVEPKAYLVKLLKKKYGFEFFLEIAQKELEMLFEKMSTKKEGLMKLWELFYDSKSVFATVLESARFFARFVEQFPEIRDGQEELLIRSANNIAEFILTIQKALAKALKITITTSEKYTSKDITQLTEVPAFFVDYLRNIIQDPEHYYPFRQHMLTISNVIQKIQIPLRRRSLSNAGSSRQFFRRSSIPESGSVSSISAILKKDKSASAESIEVVSSREGNISSFHSISSMVYEDDPQNWVEVLGTDIPQDVIVRKCYDINSVLGLLHRGPFVKLTTGLAMNHALSQFFTVYPEIYSQVRPYFIAGDITGVMVGIVTGRQAILFPNTEPNLVFRVLNASSEGLLVFVFTLGSIIKIYLLYHPETTYVSNLDFYSKFIPGPFVLSSFYTGFHSLSKPAQERYFPEESNLYYYLKKGLKFLSSFLLSGSIFQISVLNFFKTSSNPLYLLIPPGLSLAATLIQTFTRYEESIKSILSYLSLTNFICMLSKENIEYNGDISFELVSNYGRLILYAGAAGYSLIFMYRQARGFLFYFNSEGAVVTRPISHREWDEVRDSGNSVSLVSMNHHFSQGELSERLLSGSSSEQVSGFGREEESELEQVDKGINSSILVSLTDSSRSLEGGRVDLLESSKRGENEGKLRRRSIQEQTEVIEESSERSHEEAEPEGDNATILYMYTGNKSSQSSDVTGIKPQNGPIDTIPKSPEREKIPCGFL